MIELLIVVAIIGILAAIALPQYQQYIARAKLAEELTLLDSEKLSAAEAYSTNGNAFPATNASPVNTTLPANIVHATAINYTSTGTNAGIVVTLGTDLNAALNGKFLGLFGAGNADGTVTWTCATATGNAATAPGATGVVAMYPYLPTACQH